MDWTALQLLALAAALVCYGYAERRRIAAQMVGWRGRLAQRPLIAPPATDAPLIQAGRVTWHAWEQLLNQQPNRYPHVLVVGPTGAGKTTFTMALLATRPGRIAVLTPKPDPRDWPGVPIVTIGDDGGFAELSGAFQRLDRAVKARLVAAKRGQAPVEPLTIVCDDWPVLAAECGKPATDLFKLVGRLGRSLSVRLVVLSQSERVKSLGLDGEGDAVTNFARVSLARDHSGTLEGLPLDTACVPQLASRPQPADRWWRLGDGQVAGHDQVVERLLAAALVDPPARNGATSVAAAVDPSATGSSAAADPVAQRVSGAPDLRDSLPADIAQRIAGIDWRTVAELIHGGATGETVALKSLSFPPGSASLKYQVAREQLRRALEVVRGGES